MEMDPEAAWSRKVQHKAHLPPMLHSLNYHKAESAGEAGRQTPGLCMDREDCTTPEKGSTGEQSQMPTGAKGI